VSWLEEHEGAEVTWLPADRLGRVSAEALREAVEADPASVALVSVMWANNEVGTVQPIRELTTVAHEFGVPIHSDAVQAVGQLDVDYAASGLDAMTFTGHKVGGPMGVGALLLGRKTTLVPVLHGGGQEREVRSGTLDTPAIAGFAAAVIESVKTREAKAVHLTELRDDLVARVRESVPDVIVNGDQREGLGQPLLPRLRGRLAPAAPRRPRHRVLDRLGVLGGHRAAQPRPAGDGDARRGGARLAALLARPHLDQGRHRRALRGDRAGRGAGPGGRAQLGIGRRFERRRGRRAGVGDGPDRSTDSSTDGFAPHGPAAP